MTLDERVAELERRADSNDDAHNSMMETLGAILSTVRDIRRDQKHGVWQMRPDALEENDGES
jgi:hypothetical protein